MRSGVGARTLAILLAVLSAAALTSSFPRSDLDFLAWIALAPLIAVVKVAGPGSAYLLSGLAGLVFFSTFFSWIWAIRGFNPLDFVILELYFAQYFALFGLFLSLVTRRTRVPATIAAPVLWVSLEYLRSHFFFLALPMALVGHSQYRNVALIQLTSITGVYGLSFLIVLVNAALADLFGLLVDWSRLSPPDRVRSGWARLAAPLAIVVLALGATVIYGAHVLAGEPAGERIRVGVIQRDLSPRIGVDGEAGTERLDGYLALSRRLANDRPTLIVWPETAVVTPRSRPDLLAPIAGLAQSIDSYILLGSAEARKFASPEAPQRATFNSAVLVSPSGSVAGVYDKIRLVPFGESPPLAGIITWPAWLVAGADQLTPGNDHTVLRLPTARFGVVICWESLFPDLVAALVRGGADFVVNITNEAWFGTTAAPEHLAAISVFRAVEHRVPLVRAANGGMSGFVDPYGRIAGRVRGRDRQGAYGEGALAETITLPRRPTFYTRHGDVAAYLCIGVALSGTGLALVRRGRADDRLGAPSAQARREP